jgi:hypothetical protein
LREGPGLRHRATDEIRGANGGAGSFIAQHDLSISRSRKNTKGTIRSIRSVQEKSSARGAGAGYF